MKFFILFGQIILVNDKALLGCGGGGWLGSGGRGWGGAGGRGLSSVEANRATQMISHLIMSLEV